MPRTKKPFMSFQTREDFDKHFKQIYQAGYDEGFNRGKVIGLAHILVGIDDQFDSETIDDANLATKDIKLRQWKRRERFIEGANKLAVQKYIDSQKENNPD